MQDWGITEIVTSPHNNDKIRASHNHHGVNIVGYNATERQKEIIRSDTRRGADTPLLQTTGPSSANDQTNEGTVVPAGMDSELTGTQPH